MKVDDMKVLAVCGLGIGSSIILKINVEKLLNELGVDAILDVADIGSAQSTKFDMAVTNSELADVLGKNLSEEDRGRVVAINNFVDKKEMRDKVSKCLAKYGYLTM